MTATLVLDHVRAYAEQVRFHLRDLSPEQVEDLTDGLEADLAEAVEDSAGMAGGLSAGAPDAGGADGPATMIDLARRFGTAEAYAAELRAAAGLAAVTPRSDGRAGTVRARVADLWRAGADAVRPVLEARAVRRLVPVLDQFRPVWWLVRGWVWWVLAVSTIWIGMSSWHPLGSYAPVTGYAWIGLITVVLASIALGRGVGRRWRLVRWLVIAMNVFALFALPGYVSLLRFELEREIHDGQYNAEQVVQTEVAQVAQEDGVWVDGMAVSNLFVYDADGNPLSGVQIFDDRGRQVRTTYDEGWTEWALPDVVDPWRFAPALDGDGRDRWNVYPLLGAPVDAWQVNDDGVPSLVEGESLRTSPPPFAKAPAVEPQGPAGEGGDAAEGDASTSPSDGGPDGAVAPDQPTEVDG